MSEPLLSIRDLEIGPKHGGASIIKGISIEIRPQEVVAFIGASGSGKTTLALSTLGHLRDGLAVRGGSVTFAHNDMLTAGNATLRRMRGTDIAYIAQSAAASFNPRLRLTTQVIEPSLVHGIRSGREARAIALKNYGALDLPDAERIGQRLPGAVSGGQLQRFMIAMGLQESPSMLVCDEPTSALDVTTQVEVMKALKAAIHLDRTAAIFVSHDLAVVAQIATHIAVLRAGELVEYGAAEQILYAPRHPYVRELLAASEALDLQGKSAGRQGAPVDAAATRLVATGLRASFDKHGAVETRRLTVKDVSLTAHAGRTLAIIGESGSGKSTIARLLAGLHEPVSGSVELDGKELAPTVAQRSLEERRLVQMVFQSADTSLNHKHTILKILGRTIRFFHGAKYKDVQARVGELLSMVSLPPDYMHRTPAQLSGGEKQRVNLARALAAEPSVLICDEVTSALDTVVTQSILVLLRDIARTLDIALIFISHHLGTVASLADTIIVLKDGSVVEAGPTLEILGNPRTAYTQLLVASVPQLRPGWLEEVTAAGPAA